MNLMTACFQRVTWNASPKAMCIMKLISICLLVACLQVSAKGHSQTITLSEKNITLQTLLKKINRQSGFQFFYKNTLLSQAGKIDIDVKDMPVQQVLDICFRNLPVTYSIVEKTVVIQEKPLSVTPEKLQTFAEITGQVKDESGNPVAGVSVVVKGTSKGTSTNNIGRFSIEADQGDELEFSMVGYKTQTIKVGLTHSLDINLEVDVTEEKDIVVVGYGVQKKVSTTSAVSQIKSEDLVRRPVSNLQQALQGQAPGLTVLDRGGAPGTSAATIRVRGITSFSGNNDNSAPLIIVDGVEQPMFNLNPEDVESISVLKDASSTAIYGSRAANGVLLITTKRAKAGRVQINYSGYYAIQKSANDPENMATEDYMKYQQLAHVNQGLVIPARYSDSAINAWAGSTDRYRFPEANTWFQTVLKAAPQHSHNISFSGGNEFSKTRVSLRYMDQDGIAPNYGANIREFRVANDLKLHSKVKFSTDFNYRYNLAKSPFATDVFSRFLHGTLFAVPKYPDGTYGLSPQGSNPLLLSEQSGYRHQTTNYFFANGKLDYEVLDGLTLTAQVSAVINFVEEKAYRNMVDNFDSLTGRRYQVANNALTETRNKYQEITTNYLANYTKQLGKHDVRGLFGFSELYNNGDSLLAYRERFYNNDIQSIGQGANDPTKDNNGREYRYGLRSYFARLNYGFDEKYLLEVNGRYDGSSRFTGNRQYSFFPSFSAAWRISEEAFFQNLNTPFSELKLRGSWGQTGNQTVRLYSYFASLTQGSYTFGGQAVPTLSQTELADPTISWETNTQTDIGLEGALLDNKLTFSADYYKKRTTDILLALPLPAISGFLSSFQNAGTLDNKGFEFTLGYRDNSRKIKYAVNANLAINNNKVIDLKGGGPFINNSYELDPRYIVKVGLPFNSHWGYKTDGYFQTQEEIDNYPTIAPDTKPGDVKYVDFNKDGQINADDWTVIGNPFPKYTFGLVGNINYAGFTLNVLFQGAAEVDTRLSGALSEIGIFEGFTHRIVTDNYWTPDRRDAKFPLPRKSDQRNVNTSDRLIIDGSYMRLKNLQLSYSVPSSVLKRTGLGTARIYFAATNLLTFSKLNEWNLDPEAQSGRGDYFPQTRLYTIGLNLNF